MTSLNTDLANPRRGEVWRVNLDPTVGHEIQKTRPAVVVSTDTAGRMPLRLVVPVTTWKDTFAHRYWLVRIEPTPANGLGHPSAADALQTRSVDVERFVEKLGDLSAATLTEIAAAISILTEYR